MDLYNISMASNLTGLSAQLIRNWETRYGLIKPHRNSANYRVYSDSDIEKLSLLKCLTDCGFKIGLLAQLSRVELKELQENCSAIPNCESSSDAATAKLMAAVSELDGEKIQQTLNQMFLEHGELHLIFKVMIPLLRAVGDLWERGELGIHHEHYCSSQLVQFINYRMLNATANTLAPVCVISTPVNCLHELGGLMAASIASSVGWHPLYLGGNLPAEDLIATAVSKKAELVILSVIHCLDRQELAVYLKALSPLTEQGIRVLVGGSKSIESLCEHEIEVSESIEELPAILAKA